MNITYRWIRHHTFGCTLAAGVLGSLPACAQGSSVLGPGSGDSSVPELVFLGLLVVLFCGLLFGLARLAFCRTGFGVFLSFVGNSALWVLVAGFGGFGRVGSNPGYARAGPEVLVDFWVF